MEYTILQLAKLSGVSTRTIRYYEEIGLLTPAGRKENGYRMYTQKEVDVLWQILFYRELGMKLSEVADLLQKRETARTKTLKVHLKELESERERIDRLIQTVQKTIWKEEGKITMTNQEKFEGLKKEMIQKNEETYGEEIRGKYGTDKVEESNAKLMNLTEEEYADMQNTGAKLQELLEEAVEKGISPDTETGKEAYELHRKWLSFTWSFYSKEAHVGLTEMYLADERFKSYYDTNVEGCAAYLKEVVAIYA